MSQTTKLTRIAAQAILSNNPGDEEAIRRVHDVLDRQVAHNSLEDKVLFDLQQIAQDLASKREKANLVRQFRAVVYHMNKNIMNNLELLRHRPLLEQATNIKDTLIDMTNVAQDLLFGRKEASDDSN